MRNAIKMIGLGFAAALFAIGITSAGATGTAASDCCTTKAACACACNGNPADCGCPSCSSCGTCGPSCCR